MINKYIDTTNQGVIMYRVITKHIRPNQAVDFFSPKTSTLVSDETRTYIRNNYVDSGKIVHSEDSLSENGLELTITAVYQDEAAYNEWRNDTTITEGVYNIGLGYREANGITSTTLSAETI
jgi:hypothetical protein